MPEPKWWIHPYDTSFGSKMSDEEFTHNKKDALKEADKMLKKYDGIVIQRNPFTTG